MTKSKGNGDIKCLILGEPCEWLADWFASFSSTGIVQSSTGSNYVVRILSTLDREKLKPSSSVALHRHSNALVDILPPEADSSIAMLGEDEKPDVTYADVGGMDMQKQEIREAVELPLTHFNLYRQIGAFSFPFPILDISGDKTKIGAFVTDSG